MNPHIVHLNHPQQDALLLGGLVAVIIATLLLTGGQTAADEAVLDVANTSQNVTAFIQQHPHVNATVERTMESSYRVRYESSDGSTLAADVDMKERTVSTTTVQ